MNPFVKDGYVCNCLDGYEENGKTCRLPCTAEGGLDDEHYKVVVDEDNAGYIDQVKIYNTGSYFKCPKKYVEEIFCT